MKAQTTIDVLGATTEVLHSADGRQGVTVMHQVLPPGYAAPPHRHQDEDEILYLLAGRLTVTRDGTTGTVSAGQSVRFERGGWHGFVNDADTAATMLVIVTPGDRLEACFRAFDRAGRTAPLMPDLIVAIAARHGVEVAAP